MTGQIAPAGTPASSIGAERTGPRSNAHAPSTGNRNPAMDAPRLLDAKASDTAKVSPSVEPISSQASAPAGQDVVEHSRAALERFARTMRRELEFAVDEASGDTVITVRNKETGEVVRQIPAAELLALAQALSEGRPTLLDREA